VHQQHDTNIDRFWKSFGLIFGHFPLLTAVVVLGLVVVAVARARGGRLPAGAEGFLYWTFMLACGSIIGALGWATQWAHWNAYIPALTFGGIAAGAALVPLADALRGWPALAAVLLLDAQLLLAHWSPAPLVPNRADRAAGDALIARLAAIPGDVFIPSHPWYAHLAGKPTFTHRMGILDVTYEGGPDKKPLPPRAKVVEGLQDALAHGRFGAVVLDDRVQLWELPGLTEGYRPEQLLVGAAPRVVSGAPTVPRSIWLPIVEPPAPAGARVLFDFEAPRWDGWTVTGTAWGAGPVTGVAGKEVLGYRGRRFAAAADKATGTVVSPPFALSGRTVTLRVAGGNNARTERVELRDAASGLALRSATGARSGVLAPVSWSVADLRGRSVRLALVDEDKGDWGVLFVDDVREVQ
jgi:hypothetical protein